LAIGDGGYVIRRESGLSVDADRPRPPTRRRCRREPASNDPLDDRRCGPTPNNDTAAPGNNHQHHID